MTDVTTTFDGGTPGASLVAGANGIQSVPDTLVPKFIAGLHGTAAVRAGDATNTADSRFRVDLGVSGNHFGSIYMRCNTAHASAGNFVTFFNWVNSSNSIMASLRAGSARELNIRVGASTVVRAGSAGEIPDNAWFRFDWQVTGTTINWRLFYDPNASQFSTPSLSGNFTFTSATISRLVLGVQASQTINKDWSYDTIRASNTGYWYSPYNWTQTLIDNFNDNSLDTAKWQLPYTTTVPLAESGGKMTIPATSQYAKLYGKIRHNLSTGILAVKYSKTNTPTAETEVYVGAVDALNNEVTGISTPSGTYVAFNASGAATVSGSAQTETAIGMGPSLPADIWIGVGLIGSDNVAHLFKSTDGQSWFEIASATVGGTFTKSSAGLMLQSGVWSGTTTFVANFDDASYFAIPVTNVPITVSAGADTTIDTTQTFSRTATDPVGETITTRKWEIVSGPMGSGTTIGTAAALSWKPGSSPAGTTDIRQPVFQEMSYQLTSTAENSTLDWTTAYDYIEDIDDDRGYTAGLVGFTSATGDMLQLIQQYAVEKPSGNTLSPYITGLQNCVAVGFGPGASNAAATNLGQPFIDAWIAAANSDPIFRKVQRDFRKSMYWDDALTQALADGVPPLGMAIYYDVLVNHGPGNDSESFGGILSYVRTNFTKPSSGGNVTTWLNAITDRRNTILQGWGDDQATDGRVFFHRLLINGGTVDGATQAPNLNLTTPFKFTCYGDLFTVSSRPTPADDSLLGTYVLRYTATTATGSGSDDASVTVNQATPTGPTVKVWNGTSEVTGTVTVWNGTSEVPASIGSVV